MKIIFIFCFFFSICHVESQFAQCESSETCKPFQECDELKRMTEKGFLTAEERDLLRRKQCNSINRVAYVCCSGGAPAADPFPGTTPSTASTQRGNMGAPQNQRSYLPRPPDCGISLHDRIFGGEETAIDEHPWIAQIQYRKPQNMIGSHCGGSLINQRYVITAAHCEKKVPKTWKLFQVRLGEWDTRTNPDCIDDGNERICNDEYVEVGVTEIIVHENYIPDSRHQQNDIALLRLARNVVFTDFIQPICLPVDLNLRSADYTGNALTAVGFGKTESNYSSPKKLKVDLDAYPQGTCSSKYAQLGIIKGQMCAGGVQGKDSCNGDSGGPLIKFGTFANSEVPYNMLVGLVSFGPKNCGTKDQPGVYTRVSEYVNWIESKMRA